MAVILSPRGNEASNMMKRFVRYEEAAQYFGIDETLIVAYAREEVLTYTQGVGWHEKEKKQKREYIQR